MPVRGADDFIESKAARLRGNGVRYPFLFSISEAGRTVRALSVEGGGAVWIGKHYPPSGSERGT